MLGLPHLLMTDEGTKRDKPHIVDGKWKQIKKGKLSQLGLKLNLELDMIPIGHELGYDGATQCTIFDFDFQSKYFCKSS